MTEPKFSMQDGLRGRDGGPYLDDLERRNEENIRAYREKREPDYERVNADHGSMVPGHLLVDNVYSNPGSSNVGLYDRFNLVPKFQEATPVAEVEENTIITETNPEGSGAENGQPPEN